jgi:hypothetical protein
VLEILLAAENAAFVFSHKNLPPIGSDPTASEVPKYNVLET